MEAERLLSAVRSGECAALVGLSGAGKSNLLGFMANRCSGSPPLVLVDCNRLASPTLEAFFTLVCQSLAGHPAAGEERAALERAIDERLLSPGAQLCILFDRFDAFSPELAPFVYSSLRALRDRHKYRLTFITATRHPLTLDNELAELLDAHTLWLGLLSREDAAWSAQAALERSGKKFTPMEIDRLIELSWGYPGLLRACCQAYSAGCELEPAALCRHAAVIRRVNEFWADHPAEDEVRKSGLEGQPLLAGAAPHRPVKSDLTAKEVLLLEYLVSHAGEICEKDDIIRAVWPEDRVYSGGIRDDSLAQLVRRLRRKIEPDPETPRFITSIIGRGYRYIP